MIGEPSFWAGVGSVLIGSGLMDLWRWWRKRNNLASEVKQEQVETPSSYSTRLFRRLMLDLYGHNGTAQRLTEIAENETPGANATVRRMARIARQERTRLFDLTKDIEEEAKKAQ